MHWSIIFFIGALVGVFVLLLLGQDPQMAVAIPEIQWTIDVTKYLFSAFVALILFTFMFWYFS